LNDPRHYSRDDLLRDGTSVHVRAIRPDDKQRLRRHSEELSARSVYFRFLGPKKRLSDQDLTLFTELDFVNRVALVATIGKGEDERIIGVGRYAATEPEGGAARAAEVAFTVVDQYQHHGIGTLLLEHLIEIAREQGVEQLQAEVLAENRAMLGVIEATRVVARKSVHSGVVHVVFSTAPASPTSGSPPR